MVGCFTLCSPLGKHFGFPASLEFDFKTLIDKKSQKVWGLSITAKSKATAQR